MRVERSQDASVRRFVQTGGDVRRGTPLQVVDGSQPPSRCRPLGCSAQATASRRQVPAITATRRWPPLHHATRSGVERGERCAAHDDRPAYEISRELKVDALEILVIRDHQRELTR